MGCGSWGPRTKRESGEGYEEETRQREGKERTCFDDLASWLQIQPRDHKGNVGKV